MGKLSNMYATSKGAGIGDLATEDFIQIIEVFLEKIVRAASMLMGFQIGPHGSFTHKEE